MDTQTSFSRPGVLLGMSGGVDSSVCVQLLRRQGYEVTGAFILFSPAHEAALEAARRTAAQLQVSLEIIDAQALFETEVIAPFCREYCAGRTPNPCILCNPAVKFACLAIRADALGLKYLATGHYAQVQRGGDGVFRVTTAASGARDQSYMLYRLGQDVLRRLLLPLGGLEKSKVRQLAQQQQLACADAPDSMEICFIPDGDYAGYIEARGLRPLPGHFIGPDGQDLGPHKGVCHYTVGQRKGLGLALGQPAFVRRIAEDGNIFLDWSGREFFSGVTLCQLATPDGAPLPAGEYRVKIRSAAPPVPCRFDGEASVTFASPARAPAPGQSAVLYRDGAVWGGGLIEAAW